MRPRLVVASRVAVALVSVFVTALGGAATARADVELRGFGALRALAHDAEPAFRDADGGFGRLDVGDGEESVDAVGELQLAIDWRPSGSFGAFVHALARAEPGDLEGDAVGVVEAYVEGTWSLPRGLVRLQLGHFLLPTSRENIEVAWSSPYSLTSSALNTWIGEEVRLTGASARGVWDLALDDTIGRVDQLELLGAAFGGNDTAGALLAWRGWSLGSRLVVFDEVVPLPPLSTLEPGAGFGEQRDDGTKPFGADIDDQVGWAASAAWRRVDRAEFRVTRYDNRGDLDLHGGLDSSEYAWGTDFWLVGAEAHHGRWDLVAEWMDGETAMGVLPDAKVRAGFRALYGLVSWRGDGWRLTLRRDEFETVERDRSLRGERNDEDGHAWTIAGFWEPLTRPLRLGVEWLRVESTRPGLVDERGPGASLVPEASVDEEILSLELRWYF
ncbi:MAG: hypothetical protein AAGC60_20265 [Acidobacteriota bacterium]